ncbi:MAG TPA: TetR/AcrR family transcriptional regulator [Acidimicrobiales bacterium]|nr:TetR/AcrR family transcriptional regulator [Acidimicrobiales bacterium]
MTATKGTRTRQRILDAVGPMFNERGYQATSLADVMAATGLEKGGIYNHFASKDDLAVAAYERNAGLLADAIGDHVRAARPHAVDRLVAVLAAFRSFAHEPPFPGGCPTLNTAVESAGLDPRLRDLSRQRLLDLRDGLVGRLLRRGVELGQLRADLDVDELATTVAAGIEGALLLAQALGDPTQVDRVADHLERTIREAAA